VNQQERVAMANTYTSLHYHIIFSTKNRVRCINAEIEQRVWAYLGGVARKHGMSALQVGGFEDHVHVLVMTPPTLSPSQIAQFLKGDSSKWIHGEFQAMRDFAWQDGYGAFTVSKSNLPEVIRYIQQQREHHHKKTFQEEYREFLRKHGVEYDERYVWG
jgi:putative transposase